MAEELRAYAREGIGHVQLVVDPITEASIEDSHRSSGCSTPAEPVHARIARLVLLSGVRLVRRLVLGCGPPCEVRITARGGARARGHRRHVGCRRVRRAAVAPPCRVARPGAPTPAITPTPPDGAGDRRPDLQRDPPWRPAADREQRDGRRNGEPLVKTINADVANWPLIISEYRARARCATRPAGTREPARGRATRHTSVGINILVEFGPTTGQPDAARRHPPAAAKDLIALIDPLLWPLEQRSTPSRPGRPPASSPAPAASSAPASATP